MTMNLERVTSSSSIRRPRLPRFLAGAVLLVISLLVLLPSFSNAQRVAPLGSRLKRRFGGSRSGSYVVEQGEDADGGSCGADSTWMSSMIHAPVERPGMFAVGLAFLVGYLYFLYYQERLSEIERKLHQKFKRQLSSGGEFLLSLQRKSVLRKATKLPWCSFLSFETSHLKSGNVFVCLVFCSILTCYFVASFFHDLLQRRHCCSG